MIIMGIDPGTATTGWGVIRLVKGKAVYQAAGIISTPAHTPLSKRLLTIYKDINQLISEFHPSVLSLEELFFNTNAKTALLVGQARGIILLVAELHSCKIVSYTPLQVKMAITGYGRADKRQMQQMVKTILTLPSTPKPDDAADALAIALTYSYSYKFNRLKR